MVNRQEILFISIHISQEIAWKLTVFFKKSIFRIMFQKGCSQFILLGYLMRRFFCVVDFVDQKSQLAQFAKIVQDTSLQKLKFNVQHTVC